jgi:peptidoglycan/xylan/chitin deacetylase (PgdA/CDA1 family)
MRGHLLVDVPLAAAAIALSTEFGWPAIAGAAALSTAIHSWAVIDPRSSLYMPVCWRLPRSSPGLALTFDDGPNPEITPRLLDLLGARGQRATFFVIGEHVRRAPELLRRMLSEGHAIGLHSDSHSRLFNCWPPGLVRRDLERCGAAIADATGQPPPRLFRPPVGLKNPVVGHVCSQMKLRTITWTARGRDTHSPAPEVVLARLRPALAPGSIVTLHDGCEPRRPRERASCLEVVGRLCDELDARSLRSLPLAETAEGVALGLTRPADAAAPLASAAGA